MGYNMNWEYVSRLKKRFAVQKQRPVRRGLSTEEEETAVEQMPGGRKPRPRFSWALGKGIEFLLSKQTSRDCWDKEWPWLHPAHVRRGVGAHIATRGSFIGSRVPDRLPRGFPHRSCAQPTLSLPFGFCTNHTPVPLPPAFALPTPPTSFPPPLLALLPSVSHLFLPGDCFWRPFAFSPPFLESVFVQDLRCTPMLSLF